MNSIFLLDSSFREIENIGSVNYFSSAPRYCENKRCTKTSKA